MDRFTWYMLGLLFILPQIAILYALAAQMWSERKERQRIERIMETSWTERERCMIAAGRNYLAGEITAEEYRAIKDAFYESECP